jgi:hypothetical protein
MTQNNVKKDTHYYVVVGVKNGNLIPTDLWATSLFKVVFLMSSDYSHLDGIRVEDTLEVAGRLRDWVITCKGEPVAFIARGARKYVITNSESLDPYEIEVEPWGSTMYAVENRVLKGVATRLLERDDVISLEFHSGTLVFRDNYGEHSLDVVECWELSTNEFVV